MLGKLLLLFVVVPLIELVLLIKIGDVIAIGLGDTPALLLMVGLIILTGILGGFLAKREGLSILRQLRNRLASGEVPGTQLLDGAMVLVSGALLITPGVLTDVVGFLGLLPPTRTALRRWALQWFKTGLARGTIRITYRGKPFREDDPSFREAKEEPIDIG